MARARLSALRETHAAQMCACSAKCVTRAARGIEGSRHSAAARSTPPREAPLLRTCKSATLGTSCADKVPCIMYPPIAAPLGRLELLASLSEDIPIPRAPVTPEV